MLLKGGGVILFALVIDSLQAFISLGLVGVIAGVSAVPFVGTIVGGAAAPIGLLFGIIINACLSLTLGSAFLLVVLPLAGMFYPMQVLPAFIEVVPGLNNLPVWTIAAVRCVYKKYKDEKKTKHSIAGVAVRLASGGPVGDKKTRILGVAAAHVLGVSRGVTQPAVPQTQNAPRVPLQTKNFDGIRRPANDNFTQPYAKAA